MDRALVSLLHSPQNNLRIFKDGCLVYDEKRCGDEVLLPLLRDWLTCDDLKSCVNVLVELLRCALTRPFDAQNEVRSESRFEEMKDDLRVDAPCRLQPELVDRVNTLLSLANEVKFSLFITIHSIPNYYILITA